MLGTHVLSLHISFTNIKGKTTTITPLKINLDSMPQQAKGLSLSQSVEKMMVFEFFPVLLLKIKPLRDLKNFLEACRGLP